MNSRVISKNLKPRYIRMLEGKMRRNQLRNTKIRGSIEMKMEDISLISLIRTVGKISLEMARTHVSELTVLERLKI